MREEWRDIIDYEGLYQVSNLGEVKSLEKLRGIVIKKEHLLSLMERRDGYCQVTLTKNGKSVKKLVHVLVAQAFIPNYENKKTVNHIDGNKQNNTVNNLEWNTQRENIIHAYENGLKARGTQRKDSKLSAIQVKEILDNYIPYDRKFGTRALAHKYNVNKTTIWRIVNNKSYKDI